MQKAKFEGEVQDELYRIGVRRSDLLCVSAFEDVFENVGVSTAYMNPTTREFVQESVDKGIVGVTWGGSLQIARSSDNPEPKKSASGLWLPIFLAAVFVIAAFLGAKSQGWLKRGRTDYSMDDDASEVCSVLAVSLPLTRL